MLLLVCAPRELCRRATGQLQGPPALLGCRVNMTLPTPTVARTISRTTKPAARQRLMRADATCE